MNKQRKTSHILNIFQYDHATGIIGLNGAPVSGYGLYLTTNINDGSVGIDSSASINALYLLKNTTKQFEISYDTSGATKIFRLLPYQSGSSFQIGNPSNAANSNTDYVFISESVYGNVLIGPGIGNAVTNLTGATAATHKIQFNGAIFANNSIQATSFVITGGASTGFLKADGTVDAVTYLSGNQSITVSGDATGSGTTAITLTLANTAVTPGTYGSTTLVPVVTVDSKGRITSVTTAAISGSLTFTGDVTGTGTTGTSTAMTLAASGVTAGTYTKVTVDSKGRVTVGANASTTDISEGTNLYYTDTRARLAISVTGSGSYNSATGVITVTGGVTSVNTLTGAVTLTTTNIAEGTNLYYTDARVSTYLTTNSYATQTYVGTQIANLVASAPATLDTLNELAVALGNDPNFATTVATSIGTKQAQLNGTGFVKISGTTISYDNSTYLTSASLTGYVPYTGATGTVNLGVYDIKSNSVLLEGNGVQGGSINFKQTAGVNISGSGYTSIGASGTDGIAIHYGGASVSIILKNNLLTAQRAFSFPNSDGTLALTSNIPTNNNQLTNGAGYITSYTEVDTLASVTARGASSTTTLTLTRTDITNIYVGNAVYFGGGNNYLNWTNSRIYSNVGIETAGTISASNFSGTSSGTNTGDQTTITGNAGTVTNGVYTVGDQTIGGTKTFSANIINSATADWYMYGFGARGASSGQYGIGLGSDIVNRTLSFHVPSLAAYSSSGNIPKFGWYSNGALELMSLQSATGNLIVYGTIGASNFSGTHSGSSSGTNTGDQTNISGTAASETLATVTARGATSSQVITLSGTANNYSGHHYFIAYDAAGNHYPHYQNGSSNVGAIVNTRVYTGSGGSWKLFVLNGQTGGISWDGNVIYHAGNIPTWNQSTTGNAATATSAGVLTASGSLTTQFGSGTVGYVYGIATGTTGLFYATNNSNSIITINRHPGDYYSQLGFSSSGGIFYRHYNNTAINTTLPWAKVWTSDSLINLDQLSNGPGYITGYTETDTLASVTGRGATTTAAITISKEALAYGGTTQSFLIDGAGGNAALTINAASAYAYLNFAQTGVTKWEIGAEGSATNKGSLYFNHNVQSGSAGAALYLKKSNGYVGILNTDPQVALHVTGAGTFTGNLNAANLSGTNTGDQTNISGNAATATSATQVVTIQDAAPSGSAGKLWWESDTGKLKVYYGSAWVDASPIPDSSLFFAKAGGSITGDVTIGQTLNVVGNTLVQGTISAFGDVIAYSSSDARLKDNITVIDSPLEKVSKINGVSFNWNDKQTAYEVGKKDIGVIAQEIEEVLPELVTTRDNGYKAVRYEKIVALLIEAVKEQQTQINNLTDKLNNL